MQAAQISFGDVMSQCVQAIRSRLGLVSATILLITAGLSLFDVFISNRASFVPGIVVNMVVQYHFLEAMLLGKVEKLQRQKPKYASLFLSGFLGGLGIIAGLIALILPGIFLMARWSISAPFIVVDGMTGSEALGASWEATSESRWVLFAIFLVSCVTFGLTIVGLAAVFDMTSDGIFFTIGGNFFASLWSVGGWILAVGIYRCLRPLTSELEAVFA